jgi:hypothetical protein
VVAEEWIRAVAVRSKSPEIAFAAGRLAEREERRRRRAGRSVKPAWKQLRRRGRKAWA